MTVATQQRLSFVSTKTGEVQPQQSVCAWHRFVCADGHAVPEVAARRRYQIGRGQLPVMVNGTPKMYSTDIRMGKIHQANLDDTDATPAANYL